MTPKQILIGFITMTAVVFAVFGKSLPYEFLNWDDEILVVLNPHIRGFSLEHLHGMFFNGYGLFIPMLYISFAFDHLIYGLDPWGFRMSNLIQHALNSCMVFYIFTFFADKKKYLNREVLICGLLFTAIWALHPLRVESVVWIAERKDTLSGFFILLSLIFYLRYSASRCDIDYLKEKYPDTLKWNRHLSILFYILALVSKPSVLPFPAVLVLLDFYPFKRIQLNKDLIPNLINAYRRVWDFLALSILAAIGTFCTASSSKAMITQDFYPLYYRITNAIYNLGYYVYCNIWPVGIRPYHPMPRIPLSNPMIYFSLILYAAAAYYIFRSSYKKSRYELLTISGIFFIMLFPFLGIFQVGLHGFAARYTYLSTIPFFIGFGYLMLSSKKIKLFQTIATVWLLALIVNTFYEQNIWQNTKTYFTELIAKAPEAPTLFYNKLGDYYMRNDEPQNAIPVFTEALNQAGDSQHYAHSAYNLANAHYQLKEYDNAEKYFNVTIQHEPESYLSYNTIGHIYLQKKELNTATEYYQKSIDIFPHAQAYNNLGYIGLLKEDYEFAEKHLIKAIELNPSYDNAKRLLQQARENLK